MKRDDKTSGNGDPENKDKRKRSAPPGKTRRLASDISRALACDEGHSGYGSESVRPYLRAQLQLKELLGTPFMPPEPWEEHQKRTRKTPRGGN